MPVEVCVDDRGTVSEVRILRSSRFPAHDPKIVSELGRWRYAPFEVRGVAERACGMVNIPYGPQRD